MFILDFCEYFPISSKKEIRASSKSLFSIYISVKLKKDFGFLFSSFKQLFNTSIYFSKIHIKLTPNKIFATEKDKITYSSKYVFILISVFPQLGNFSTKSFGLFHQKFFSIK